MKSKCSVIKVMSKQVVPKVGEKNSIVPALYLVATPIGNLRDITLRAMDVLQEADVIYCEDTRVSRKLLQTLGIKKIPKSYHDYSTTKVRENIVATIQKGKAIALISDAGMPCISDPGYKLVRLCRDEGVDVFPVPGANAPLAALSASGLPTDRFHFCGFLPTKLSTRRDILEPLIDLPATIILFETAKKLSKTLETVHTVMGRRPIVIAREVTKKFEEYIEGYTDDLIEKIKLKGSLKGEIVLLIAPNQTRLSKEIDQDTVDSFLAEHLAGKSLKDAVEIVTEITGMPRKVIYARALFIKGSQTT